MEYTVDEIKEMIGSDSDMADTVTDHPDRTQRCICLCGNRRDFQ